MRFPSAKRQRMDGVGGAVAGAVRAIVAAGAVAAGATVPARALAAGVAGTTALTASALVAAAAAALTLASLSLLFSLFCHSIIISSSWNQTASRFRALLGYSDDLEPWPWGAMLERRLGRWPVWGANRSSFKVSGGRFVMCRPEAGGGVAGVRVMTGAGMGPEMRAEGRDGGVRM